MKYYCGIDTGGTFTDCVVIDQDGMIVIGKSPSTPADYSIGFFNALETCAGKIGIGLGELLKQTEFLFLGTTVGTNALLQMKGAKTGIITTRGHRDNLHIMRSAGRSVGLPIEKLLHVSRHQKPAPIVPKSLILEVSERIDWKGEVFLPLNRTELEEAARQLVQEGVEAIGICFLWSIVNPEHERVAKEIIQSVVPDVYVTCSHELIAKRGEYERAVGTAINGFIGPIMKKYVEMIERRADGLGYQKPILVLQVTGGVVPSNEVLRTPLYTISSGPAGGVTGTNFVARELGFENAIITDMGGTSFEAGLIYNGRPLTTSETIINQYVFLMPRLHVESIGSGGGSILWMDASSGTLKVGPESAGADPGPACYGKGTRATVTDANLVLGYLNPHNFLGGKITLDREKSVRALEPLAAQLGMQVHEVAAGAVRIAENEMAELIRQMTLQKGLDPREFVVFAYGGAGPTHACQYARALGIRRVVVPLGSISSTWSAFGTLCADIQHVYEQSELLTQPFNLERINAAFAELEGRGKKQLERDGVAPEQMVFQRFVEMKYRMQIHQLLVPVKGGILAEEDLQEICGAFEEIYESFYGKGSAYREAGIEIGLIKAHAVGRMPKPKLPRIAAVKEDPSGGTREVYWGEQGQFFETPIFRGEKLVAGDAVFGPAVVEFPETTVVVHPYAKGTVDEYGNFILEISGGRA